MANFQCTSCGKKLDRRKKSSYKYKNYPVGSAMDILFGKNIWVFCSSTCQFKADIDFASGNFAAKHGKKMIDFKP